MLSCWLPSWQPSATISQSAQRWAVARGVPASTTCTMSSCWSVATRNLERPRTRSSLWTRTSGGGPHTPGACSMHCAKHPAKFVTLLPFTRGLYPNTVRHRNIRYIQQRLCSLRTRLMCNDEWQLISGCLLIGTGIVCRDQFSIPQATPAYEEIVRQLPSEFVGPASSETLPSAL